MPLVFPVGDDISAQADWVELKIASTAGDMPFVQLDRLLKAEGTELADEELAASDPVEAEHGDVEVSLTIGQAVATEVDVRVEMIIDEIRERREIGQTLYPYMIIGDRVVARDVCGAPVYYLLLVLGSSELPFRTERRAHEVEEAFDFVAIAALRRFLGRGATGLRFARTARSGDTEADDEANPDRRPTSFPAAIEWLRDRLDIGRGDRDPPNERLVEPHWEDADQSEPPLGRQPLSSYNDAGVDAVVWWKFADRRAGFPVLLAQCTVQLDWQNKLEDIKLVLWEKWIDFDTVPPQRVLVIPFADPRDHPLWRDRTARAGVIIDRVRLLELLNELDCTTLAELISADVRAWTDAELAAV